MEDIEPSIQLCWYFLVQFWCNGDGKDGNYALDGQSWVDTIERMDRNYPHIHCVHLSRTIRNQEFILIETKWRRRTPIELRVRGGDCIFLEGKSQEMHIVGVCFGMFQSFPGAILVQPAKGFI